MAAISCVIILTYLGRPLPPGSKTMPQTHASQFPADFAPPAALAESAASAYCDLIDTSDENDVSPSFAFPIETPHFDRNRAEYLSLIHI